MNLRLKLGFDRVIASTILSATGARLTISDVHLHGGSVRESGPRHHQHDHPLGSLIDLIERIIIRFNPVGVSCESRWI